MIDYAPMWTAEGKPADQRAAPLQNLKPGWTVRLAANGDVERRMPSGQVSGRYGRDALDHAVAEGWLVETRRRGDVVEYAPSGAPVATAAKPETKRRPAKPKRVKRTTRRKAAPAPSASVAPPARGPARTDPPRPAEPEATPKPKPAAKRKRARPRRTDLPTAPRPLPDGTECLSREAAAERWGCSAKAVAQAAQRGHVDEGGRFVPAGAKGGPRRTVALTPKTLAYAARVWADVAPPPAPEGEPDALTQPEAAARFGVSPEAVGAAVARGRVDAGPVYHTRGRPGRSVALTPRTLAYAERVWGSDDPARWTTPAPKRAPWHGRAVTLERGAVLLQGEVLAALGMGPAANNRASRAIAGLRTPGHGMAWHYAVDDALVSLLEELGFAVTLTDRQRSAEPARLDAEAGTPDTLGKGRADSGPNPSASRPETRPAGTAEGDGHWSSLLPEALPVDTPHFV